MAFRLILLTLACSLAPLGCFNPEDGPADGTDGMDTDATNGSTSAGTSTITTTVTESVSESDSAPTTVDPTGDTTSTDSTDGSSSTGACEGAGCTCSDNEPCDEGFYCDGVCMEIVCGDELVHEPEVCDDGNTDDGDGCDADCTFTEIVMDVSYRTTCALIEGGSVRCWGANGVGQLGYGFTDLVGDDEHPWEVGDVQLPGLVSFIQSGDLHTCALLEDMPSVVCWGGNFSGQLGYGNTEAIGDDEFPSTLTPVDVGANVQTVTTGGSHTCAVTVAGQVVCWGSNFGGELGYGHTNNIGDDELPSSAGTVDIGAAIETLSGGIGQTCVIQANGAIRCWGLNFSGQLGYGHTNNIGDDELPTSVQALDFEEDAVQITAGLQHTCALFESGNVRCWGQNNVGQLGQGHTESLGDDELATTIMPIDLGDDGMVTSIAAGDNHTCALFDTGALRCWGNNMFGQLGLGNVDHVGDDELPTAVDAIDFPSEVIQFDAGGNHTCAVLADRSVRCWGDNAFGQLGLANVDLVGDDELPMAVEPVQVLQPLR